LDERTERSFMVDFQERDTRRSLDDEDDDDEADDASGGQVDDDHEGHEHDDHGHESHEHDDHGQDDEHSHDHHAHDMEVLGIAVVTVSSSRSREDDPSGDIIESRAEADGHEVVVRDVVRDDYDGIQGAVDNLVGRDDVDVLVTTGGTGVTPDDVTIEAVESLFEKELPGFGELFRLLSHDEIGTKVVATRATAGIADGVPVFCLPGSENAARLGIEEIILEEAPHIAGLATRE
jgi:molybdenum cofactor biosynthesis protein B